MSSHHEDVPPPPYTETDIFSASGRDAHLADDTSRSTSSTNGDVIYTPPLTPRSSHQSNFAGEVDHIASSAAAAYFETRPAPPLNSQPHIVHFLTLTAGSTPDTLPYPSDLAARDVRFEDWQTFANYLMPHHSATSNEQVIDRKLRAEAMTATNTSNKNDDARSQSSGRSHAEAQLNRVRSPVDGGGGSFDPAQQRHAVDTTVHEWNDGFFGPRRITIQVDILPTATTTTNNNNNNIHGDGLNEIPPQPEQHSPHMPGAWDTSFDQPAAAGAETTDRNGPGGGRFGFFSSSPFSGRGGRGGRGRGGGECGRGGGGFRFAGINVENDRVSIGNTFVADGRAGSLRIGGIVADGNGISINGQPMFRGTGLPGRGNNGLFPGRGRWGGPPGWGSRSHGGWGGWGGGGGAWGRGGGGACGRGGGPWGRGGWWNSSPGCGSRGGGDEGDEKGRGRAEHRGPPHHHHHHSHGSRHRSRSSSASSATSRSSSVHSESSVGSLPDYDDLKDVQLPVAKQVLQESLHHPDQPITREKVKQIKAQIKAAKQSADPAAVVADKAALRREVKDLLRSWKQLKRTQKQTRKQLRREHKQRRRQEKRERRQVKRDIKQAARQLKRDMRRGGGGGGPFGMGPPPPHPPPGMMPPMPHMPHPPPMPHMPHPPPMPHMPPMPHGMPPPPGYDDDHHHLPRSAPGAWPGDDKHHHHHPEDPLHDEGVSGGGGGAYPASQAKYQAAWEMEAKVAEKEAELLALHERIVEEQQHNIETQTQRQAEKSSSGKGEKGGGSGAGPSKMEAEAVAVEREIEELARVMERLRTEADEEFARELAEEEERAYRG